MNSQPQGCNKMISYYDFKKKLSFLLNRANLATDGIAIVPGPINNEGLFYEIKGNNFIFAYSECGNIDIICETENENEFYYHIVKHCVKYHAINYEVKHRKPNLDTRRLWMTKALQWMELIDILYYKKLKEDFEQTVLKYPFKDVLTNEDA